MLRFVAKKRQRAGIAFILTMIILTIIAAFAVAMASLASTSVQITDNRQKAGSALSAAQSGIDYAKYFAANVNASLPSTTNNIVSSVEANAVWAVLCQKLQNDTTDILSVSSSGTFADSTGGGTQITTNPVSIDADTSFSLRFFRYNALPNIIKIRVIGTDSAITKTIEMQMRIQKDSEVLHYAIAGRGRIIVTGDSTINGPVFSTWRKINWKPPVETTTETTVNGSLSTVLTKQQLADAGWQLATTDALGQPLFDADGNIIHTAGDTIQGYYEGVNYAQSAETMPGLSENDYDTSSYKTMCTTTIPVSSTTHREYFPHEPGNYTVKKDTGGYRFDRYVYDGQTFTNAKLPGGRNALFTNCTFNEVLFVESSSFASSTSKCNNVRFDNCTFNGVIVTDIPKNSSIQWIQNCLYFTGTANFNNTSSIQEATILAPNFNVNLGNTAVVEDGESSTLTGAIVGGIVDIRGNAEINGTIISTYDTSAHSEGYVSNIGFADDGGSEGGLPEDVGTIHITPSPDNLLPSGIATPIVITTLQSTYSEINN
ncbi:MAG: hypothetical protein ACYC3B_04350 [Sedimentisphaerales bacterium]